MGISERQAVRNKIPNAARHLFVAKGYDVVTMRHIAEAIEYSPTAIYLYFKDKETLIWELCREDSISLAKAFHRIIIEPDPVERLRQIGLARVQFGIDHPNHYRLLLMTSNRLDPDSLEAMGHGQPGRGRLCVPGGDGERGNRAGKASSRSRGRPP